MSGTKEGGKKASKTNLKKHGKDFYREIGRKGGSVCGVNKGFAASPERAKLAGLKGGLTSRRTLGGDEMPLEERRAMVAEIMKASKL